MVEIRFQNGKNSHFVHYIPIPQSGGNLCFQYLCRVCFIFCFLFYIVITVRDLSVDSNDYGRPTSTALTFENEESVKAISFEIKSDNSKEDPEMFEVTIAVDGNKERVVKYGVATVTIYDASTRSKINFTTCCISTWVLLKSKVT